MSGLIAGAIARPRLPLQQQSQASPGARSESAGLCIADSPVSTSRLEVCNVLADVLVLGAEQQSCERIYVGRGRDASATTPCLHEDCQWVEVAVVTTRPWTTPDRRMAWNKIQHGRPPFVPSQLGLPDPLRSLSRVAWVFVCCPPARTKPLQADFKPSASLRHFADPKDRTRSRHPTSFKVKAKNHLLDPVRGLGPMPAHADTSGTPCLAASTEPSDRNPRP